jgi:hypothetical protein
MDDEVCVCVDFRRNRSQSARPAKGCPGVCLYGDGNDSMEKGV